VKTLKPSRHAHPRVAKAEKPTMAATMVSNTQRPKTIAKPQTLSQILSQADELEHRHLTRNAFQVFALQKIINHCKASGGIF
jgi:hypothetical protein